MHIHTSNQEKFKMGFGHFTCNWGVHMCGLYETAEERDEIIFGFLNQGIIDDDIQLYCPNERSKADFTEKFSRFCPKYEPQKEQNNNVTLLTPKKLYYPDGRFSLKGMENILNSFYSDAQKEGRRNVRAVAEMIWALKKIDGVKDLMAYESRLNYFIQGKSWVSICLYNVNKISGADIMNVLRTHPYSISKKIITQNPFYQVPDKWLAENAPQYLTK